MEYTKIPRPPIPEELPQIEFEILDILMHDKANDNTILLFGVTENGNSVSVAIADYKHYFYIGCSLDEDEINENMSEIAQMFQLQEVIGYKSIYVNHRQRLHHFKVICRDSAAFSKVKSEFAAKPDTYALFNADIDERTRFLVDCGLVGCGWCKIENIKLSSRSHNCEINLEASYEDLSAITNIGNAPIRILSFDIECTSLGGFPRAENDSDKIIDIGVTTRIQGSSVEESVIFVLRKTETLLIDKIFEFESEEAMISGFFAYLLQFDPDIITGYNIDNFDWPYLLRRAEKFRIAASFSRCCGFCAKAVAKTFSSNELGTRESYEVTIPGRISLDVLPQVQIGFKLRSYSLNSVSSEFLGMQKDDVPYSAITPLFEQGPGGRRIIAQYCLKDAQLPVLLLDKLMIVFQVFELSKVTGVILQVLVREGEQVRMVSLLARHTHAEKLLIPTRRRMETSNAARASDETEDELEGATVLDPIRGYYDEKSPISTLDFSSLYPSIIIAHNLCYSTLVEADKFDIKAFNQENGSQLSMPELLESQFVTKTPQNFYFLNKNIRTGLLPQILNDLLAARKAAKKDMASAKDTLQLNVLNGRELALKTTANSLYGFTGAIQNGKLPSIEISSSVTSFGREMIELTKKIVESHYTAGKSFTIGQTTICLKNDAKVIYGDTDSVMVRFGVETLEESFLLAKDAAKYVTGNFIPPINLEFEKVYCPYLLINKKRYAGLYWTRIDAYDKIDVKGLELVRRDNCELVPIVMRKVLECLFIDHSPQLAIKYVKSIVRDLLANRIDMNLLVISKAYSEAMDDYKNGSEPHLTVVKKLQTRGVTVNIGDRIEYVVLSSNDKELYKRSEDPEYVIKNNLELDTDYYLVEQLQKPIARLLGPVLAPKLPIESAEAAAAKLLFSGEHTEVSATKTGEGIIRGLRVKIEKKCVVCGESSTEMDVCGACLLDVRKIELKYCQLLNQMRMYEFRCGCIGSECFECQIGLKDMEDSCVNKDCEIYFARIKQRMELDRVREQINKLQKLTLE